jgi:4-diphosphocytidyl-2-C-methyl-D-erythritol kinase
MQVHGSRSVLVVDAPAKLNLFFEVLAKRNDGYHEVETLMCPVTLYDTLYFEEEPSGQLELRCQWASSVSANRNSQRDGAFRPDQRYCGEETEPLPPPGENLVVRAVELLRRRAGIRAGASMRLIKRIPIASGLGGGSSDAAAALVAAHRAWGLDVSRGALADLAAELGSDVPFFLAERPAVCRGRGERIEPLSRIGTLHFVIVRPPAGLSTAAVYGVSRPPQEPQTVGPLLDALRQGNTRCIGRLLWNRLQPAAERLSPWIDRLRGEFAREDVLGHQMSGSGTAYFGLCRHARHARRVARRLEAKGIGRVFVVECCR